MMNNAPTRASNFALRLARVVSVCLACWGIAQPACAAAQADTSRLKESWLHEGWPSDAESPFSLRYRAHKPRNFWLFPALSFILPGLDQALEGQWGYAAAYGASVATGIAIQVRNFEALEELRDSPRFRALSGVEKANELKYNDTARRFGLGAQLMLASGSFSAYHAFRTAVRSQKPHGRFKFLRYEESPSDVLLAPFRFSYLKRPTTYVPLITITAIWLSRGILPEENFVPRPLTTSDGFYASAYSYLAGTHEEALFRGVLMPALRESYSNDFWSNTLTSLVFAAAHLGTVPVPVPQFLLGWYMGQVTQNNGWRIGEAVFIHAWWDVFAFLMNYHYRYQESPGQKAYLPLTLPPVTLYF